MFSTLLIANRGEIALRILRTARAMGLKTVAVYSQADAGAPHVEAADEAVAIGEAAPAQSYLCIERLIEAARASGAEVVHPGYGFLSENAEFAEACAAAGLVFIGPPASAIRIMGSKAQAKGAMERAGVPIVPGYHGERQEPDFLRQKAYEIGYPVLIKAIGGGGGRGLRRVDKVVEFEAALEAARREAQGAFGDSRMMVEKLVAPARHVEVQVFADTHGACVSLGTRDCSVQRRHQKVIEEAPAPGLSDDLRAALAEAAVKAARAVDYAGAGTVEFLVRPARRDAPCDFHFMEMNTRLQVEHGVTEAVTGLDLVEWQIRVAAGEKLGFSQGDVRCDGHAVEARLYAEDPRRGFLPSSGRLAALDLPSGTGIRVDCGLREGDTVSSHYDPLIAKVIAHGSTREAALERLAHALGATVLAGPKSNLALLMRLLDDADFRAGRLDTDMLDAKLVQLLPPDRRKAAAGLGLLRLLERGGRPGGGEPNPWDARDGFQLGPERRLKMNVEADGEAETVEIGWSADGAFTSMLGAPLGTEGQETVLVDAEDGVYVLVRGAQTFVRMAQAARAADAVAADGTLRAPMHGRVLAIAAIPRDAVRRGQVLAIVEAMKMEHALVAPFDGTVEAVSVSVGAQVAEGAALMTIAPATSQPS